MNGETMGTGYSLRPATVSDLETIVAFTLEEAREAEGLEKDPRGVHRGVLAGLEDPSLATCWVAESSPEEVVASTSAVREWSNFNGGHHRWIQSLYIAPGHWGSDLVDLLLDRVAEEAQAAGAIDLRLYAHGENARALEAYRRCRFSKTPYVVMRQALERG
jgi:ribosomal protein S18 acetylase RimI-like enzyme